MTDHVNLHLGTAYCSVLLCSIQILDAPWAYNGSRRTRYRQLQFCQKKAADRFNGVYLRSIPVIVSKILAQQSLMLG
jgi:hypothetical protein